MWRQRVNVAAVVLALAVVPGRSASAQERANANDWSWAQYLGNWELIMPAANSEVRRTLAITTQAGKAIAELVGGRGGPIKITDVTIRGRELILKWTQTSDKAAVDVVLILSPKGTDYVVTHELMGGTFRQVGNARRLR